MRFELSKFVPIALTNTFSMHLLKSYDNDQPLFEKLQILITDINGFLHLIDDQLNSQCWDLKEHLGEAAVEDFSLELVCADLCNSDRDDLFCYIATCWLFYDDLFRPRRYMLVFLRINKNFGFERVFKTDIDFAPTFTRLNIKDDRLYWLIFGHSSNVHCYECNSDSENHVKSVTKVEPFENLFPAFSSGNIFGSMTRLDQLTLENFHFDLAGFDSGYLVVSVSSTNTGVLLDRKLIKFNTPITIASFINLLGFIDQELFVVISSTIGPVSIWALKFDHENQTLSWQVRCHLLESDKNDCVLAAAITDSTILIGTYAEQLLFYSIKDALTYSELSPISQLNVGSPIMSIAPFDVEESLLILSSKGLQQYNCTLDDDSETATNILHSSNSSSPISTQNLTNE